MFLLFLFFFFFSSRRRHTRCSRDWSSDVCSSDLHDRAPGRHARGHPRRRRHAPLALPAGVVRRRVPSGLVRRGGGPVPRRGRRPGAARRQPRRGVALRRAGELGARVEPRGWPRRRAQRGVGLTNGLLLVIPPEPGVAERVPPGTLVAGLPLLRRIVLAGARAGFVGIRVHKALAGAEDLIAGTRAATLTADEPDTPRASRRIVIVPANIVPQPRWLRSLLEAELDREPIYVDPSLTAVIETADAAGILAAASRCRGAGELLAELRGARTQLAGTFELTGRFTLTARGDVRRAEDSLMRGLIKQREGFMSRHFERRISLALTRRLEIGRAHV